LRKYVEPLITKAKEDSTNSRRVVFQYLQDKESIIELFGAVAEKVANRPGGYTRILKTGSRLGDNAEMCVMELVDYNELLLQEAKPKAAKRSRRSKSKSKSKSPSSETSVVEEAEVVASEPEVKDETIEASDPKTEASDEEEEKKD